jgi:hypothetical protein
MCVLIFIGGVCLGAVVGVGALAALVKGDLEEMDDL